MWIPFRKARQPVASIADAMERLRELPPHEAVRLLDSGALDEVILRHAAAESAPQTGEAYANLEPFSYDDWKRRHRVAG